MKYLVLLITFATFSFSFGQGANSQAVLNKLSSKIKGLSSFYVEFSAITKSPNGKTQSEIGRGWVKGNKFSAVYGETTILSNGYKQWTIVKEDKSVYVSDASKSDGLLNPKKLMTIWDNNFNNIFEKYVTVNGKKCDLIRLVPKNPGKVEFHSIYVTIDPASNELKRAIVKMKNGNSMTYTLTKFTSNPSIDDSKFVYDARKYPGYDLVRD